jgi:hypothetical protein
MQLLLIILHATLATTSTISNSSSYYSVPWFPKPLVPQFRNWYPKYSEMLSDYSTGACNVTYNDYQTSYNAPAGSYDSSLLLIICYQHEDCLLENIAPNIMVNFQSATVILGLMPTLLSTIGPSVAEISLVSAHRPILAFLISMGAPAIWPTRIFEYNNPTDLLIGSSSTSKLELRPLSFWLALTISALQYLLAAGSVFNIMNTSIILGERSILSWGCTTNFMPLVWTSAACIVHITAAASYIVARKRTIGSSKEASTVSHNNHSTLSGRLSAIYRGLKAESTICANQRKLGYTQEAKVPLAAVFLNVCAGCLGFIYLVLGTLVFSSLQFISVWDIFNEILWRYMVSTVVCRMILIVELAGLRRSN